MAAAGIYPGKEQDMKIRSTLAKAFSTTLVAAMLMAGVPEAAGIQTPFAVTAQAAKKKTVKKKKKAKKVKKKYKENPKLSRTRLSLRNRKTAKIKVSGTKKGISFTSSDKSIATVSRSGKYAFRIRAAKKKKGAAVIRVKTSRGYKYLFVQVGGGTNMSQKTRAWAQAGGFIQVPQPSTPQAQKPETVPAVPAQPQQPVQPSNPQPQQPAVTQPQTQPQTQPETQPQTQPQTQPSTPSDDDYELTWNGAVILHNERDLAASYDAHVAELCGVNNPNLSKWQKLYNFIRWFSYTYPYNVVGDFNSYYPFVWKRDLEMYPNDAPNFGYNCGSAADVVIAWAHKYIGSPTNNDNGPGHSAVVKANDYNGHFYARIEIDGKYYIAEPLNYQNQKMKEDLENGTSLGLLYKDPLTSDSRYYPTNVGY
jgi:hypothetical protein